MTSSRAVALALVLVLAGLAGASRAGANTGVFGGSGQTVRLEGTADVAMEEEDVTIFVGRSPWPFDESLSSLDVARFECRFGLKNRTDREIRLQVGFPIDAAPYVRGRREERDPRVDLGFLVFDADTTYAVRYVGRDAKNQFASVFLWDMVFAPGQRRDLVVRYELDVSTGLADTTRRAPGAESGVKMEGVPPWLAGRTAALGQFVSYVTRTGATWADGRVGKARFRLLFQGYEEHLRRRGLSEKPKDLAELAKDEQAGRYYLPRSQVQRTIDPGGGRTIPGGLEWVFENWKPEAPIAAAWYLGTWPCDPTGLARLVEITFGPTPKRSDLALLREVLLGCQGIEPADPTARAFLSTQVWYAPVAGRSMADLDADARAMLDDLDRRIAAVK